MTTNTDQQILDAMKGIIDAPPKRGDIPGDVFGDIPSVPFGDIPGSVFGDVNTPG